jgi:16S rRNA (cytidine1402-2'-O)-methyltransferase
LSVSYAPAVQAAREIAGQQDYPKGALWVIATPIGNLADVSLRALVALERADTLACEDTRHSQQLLRSYGMDTSARQWVAVHQHNEMEACQGIIERLRAGQSVAYMSDAGTPGISDPGARLVAACHAAGLRVMPLPGASSVITALSAAGVCDDGAFVFQGFLPARGQERQTALHGLAAEQRTVVLLEAPHRIASLCTDLATLGTRPVTLARELTKQYEDVVTLPASQTLDWLQADAHRQKGEFVVVIHAGPAEATVSDAARVLGLLLKELPLKTAVRLAADITGEPRNALYTQALALKNSDTDNHTPTDTPASP